MKLPKFLSRKNDEEEDLDDSDFDPSDFEGDEYDGVPKTQVIDDDTELAIEIEDDLEAESMENFQDRADLTELEAQMQSADDDVIEDDVDDVDDVDFGDEESSESAGSNASDETDDDIELDDESLDDEDFDDEDFEDEDEAGGDPRRMLVFAGIGAGVLLLGVVGGAAFWFFSDGGGGAGGRRDPAERAEGWCKRRLSPSSTPKVGGAEGVDATISKRSCPVRLRISTNAAVATAIDGHSNRSGKHRCGSNRATRSRRSSRPNGPGQTEKNDIGHGPAIGIIERTCRRRTRRRSGYGYSAGDLRFLPGHTES